MLKNPFRPRLLKKVQMQGGAHCGMRIAECGMGEPVRRSARPSAPTPQMGLFQQPPEPPRSPRLLKKVQVQGGARRAE
jgi:hypothetical protein